MSVPQSPIGDGSVPDKVLEELLAAFSGGSTAADIEDLADFDDPTIDTILDIEPAGESSGEINTDVQPVIATTDDDLNVWRRAKSAAPEGAEHDTVTSQVEQLSSANVVAPKKQTIKIGGDDQPDAMYLNEEAGERLRGSSGRATEASISGERNTILIVSDDLEGLSGGIPLATNSASMDPRLRARRIAVRRAIGRRRLKWFVIIGVVLVLVAGSLTLLGSSIFAISHVTPSGARRIDDATLQSAVDDLMGTPALLVDTRKVERALELSPWVEKARVSVHFPHNATIELVVRVPLATYAGTDNRFRIMSVDGIVVDVIAGQPLEFMLVKGPGPNVEPGKSSGQAFTHAAELVEALSPTVRRLTALVNVGDTGDLSLIFHGKTAEKQGTTVILGAATDLLDKLTRLEAFLQRDGSDQCTLINVSTSPISHKC